MPPLTAEDLQKARDRAQHVIVLMLENRSFDHMLGWLDGLAVDDLRNPYDLNQPADAVGFSFDAESRLENDPPHGHRPILDQMTGSNRFGRLSMDGFVASYLQKLAGQEPTSTPRWGRLAGLAVVAGAVVGVAVHALARLALLGGWNEYWASAWVAGVVVGFVVYVLGRFDEAPLIDRTVVFLGWIGGTAIASLTWDGLVADRWRGAGTWVLFFAAVGLLAVERSRRRFLVRKVVPTETRRAEAAKLMRAWGPDGLPVLGELARRYAVCTRWFSSVPGATWPNRNFAVAGTSEDTVDIEIGFYNAPTIFQQLEDAAVEQEDPVRPWRIYHEGVAQVMCFEQLWRDRPDDDFHTMERLFADIAEDTLPRYAFVEPAHSGPTSNSQHPGNNMGNGDDFERGERLIGAIHDALVAAQGGGVFAKTLFLITYDEHGGFPDRVPPPRAPAPTSRLDPSWRRGWTRRFVALFLDYGRAPFRFTRLGVRVPTVVVSPWITPGKLDPTYYDHTSLIATVRALWAPKMPALGRRDRAANDVLHLLVAGDVVHPAAALGAVRRLTADEVDPWQQPDPVAVETAVQGDELGKQLATLGEAVRNEVDSEEIRERLEPARQERGVDHIPTAVLFKAAGDSTYNGNPPVDGF
jgi:hypothetical protein